MLTPGAELHFQSWTFPTHFTKDMMWFWHHRATHELILQRSREVETEATCSNDLESRAAITSISCVQFLSHQFPFIILNLCPRCSQEGVFLLAGSGSFAMNFLSYRSNSAGESEKTQFCRGETLPAFASFFPRTHNVNTHTHTHTHKGDVCEIWKAYSRETHLISVSVITIIIGTPLHRVRARRTVIE